MREGHRQTRLQKAKEAIARVLQDIEHRRTGIERAHALADEMGAIPWEDLSPEEQDFHRPYDEEAERFSDDEMALEAVRLADALLPAMQMPQHPWPTFHRLELANLLAAYNGMSLPDSEALIQECPEFLRSRRETAAVTLELPFACGALDSVQPFDPNTGIAHLELTESGRQLIVHGSVTRMARSAFAQAVRAVAAQAVILSQLLECVPQSIWSPSPRNPLSRIPADAEDDGWMFACYPGQEDASRAADVYSRMGRGDDAMHAMLGHSDWVPADAKAPQRLAYLLSAIVFRPTQHHPETNNETREEALRQSVWHMAQLSRLGPGMIALIGYLAIVERIMACTVNDCREWVSPLADDLADRAGLGTGPRGQLRSLLALRNRGVHELRNDVAPSDVRVAWSLAKTSIHHLVTKMTDTWETPTRRQGHDLQASLETILERTLFLDLDPDRLSDPW